MLWMPWFCQNAVLLFLSCFCQNDIVLRFHKNVLFLISIIWSLLHKFNTKIFTFPLPLLPKSVCFVTHGICDRDVIVVCVLSRIYIFLELETMSLSKLAANINCRNFAMIFAIFTKVCRVFCHFLPWFSAVPRYIGSRSRVGRRCRHTSEEYNNSHFPALLFGSALIRKFNRTPSVPQASVTTGSFFE